jgi:adenine phosphoribosyltransferase
MTVEQELRESIRTIPDFPKPGILFKDLTPVFQDAALLGRCLDEIQRAFDPAGYAGVGGIEARGFILGALVAHTAARPFFPFRKAGKLPWKTVRETYSLEYGEDSIEIHTDAFSQGARILIVDDLLATGGTAAAAARLVRRAGGDLVGVVFLVELAFLGGREKMIAEGIEPEKIVSLVKYRAGE